MPTSETRLTDEGGRLAALDRYRLRSEGNGPLSGFERITDLVADLLDVPICSISVITDDVQYFAAIKGEVPGLTARSEAVCARTIERYEPFTIPDLSADERFAAASFVTDERHFRGYAGIPLTTGDGYNVGALCIIDREPRQFSAREIGILRRFGDLVVEQMELRTLADMDFLTGAMSRRAFTERADALLRRASGEGTALVVFDIDHFKQVNDRFGHAQGDEVLHAVVETVTSMLRPGDAIGRIGGEEFAVLLPRCGSDEALACAERFRAGIAATRFDAMPSVTASFGVATSGANDFLAWLEQADLALYEAKRAGRNRARLANLPARAA